MNTRDVKDVLTRYKRAEQYEHAMYDDSLVRNASVYASWIDGGNQFWYRRKLRDGKEYLLVDPQQGATTAAFDHKKLAEALSAEVGKPISAEDLPIVVCDILLQRDAVTFTAFERKWEYFRTTGACVEVPLEPEGLISPDGQKVIYAKVHNLWCRDIESDQAQPLTRDGIKHYAYGALPERISLAFDVPEQAIQGMWSPDSRYFFTLRTDERQVKDLPVTRYVPTDGSARPVCTPRKYALPGDEQVPRYEMLVIDTQTQKVTLADYPPVVDAAIWANLFTGGRAWWHKDSRKACFVDSDKYFKTVRVVEFDVDNGKCRSLFEEQSDTHIELGFEFESASSSLYLPDSNELIWWSERNGWAHLYLYDLTSGDLKHPITQGEWVVREVLCFDAKRREVFIQLAGRDKAKNPYYRELARVNIDTGDMTLLVEGDHDVLAFKPGTMLALVEGEYGNTAAHTHSVSPTDDYAVVTITRPDKVPYTLLVNRQGEEILTLETADVAELPSDWVWPEPVQGMAADGVTELYGVVFRPSYFDASGSYPVIDIAFTNSFYAAVPHGAFGTDTMINYYYMSASALAELGFIVVMVDGRGSLYRSKAFHDHAYGRVERGSDLEDHVAFIRQLGETRSYMDLERVGIMDWGGSYGPIYGMCQHGDFYKAGAVASIWDPRLVMQGTIYQGPDADLASSAAGSLAENLEGPLLLIQGMLDNFFHPGSMLQVVDALVKANKNFDLVMLPNGGHAWDSNRYGTRRMWDFMVKHLRNEQPPEAFRLTNGTEKFAYGLPN